MARGEKRSTPHHVLIVQRNQQPREHNENCGTTKTVSKSLRTSAGPLHAGIVEFLRILIGVQRWIMRCYGHVLLKFNHSSYAGDCFPGAGDAKPLASCACNTERHLARGVPYNQDLSCYENVLQAGTTCGLSVTRSNDDSTSFFLCLFSSFVVIIAVATPRHPSHERRKQTSLCNLRAE
jgi:hypothetical protein